MISAFHYESDPDSDMEASMLDQYTAFEMLTPTEKFKKYVERKRGMHEHTTLEKQKIFNRESPSWAKVRLYTGDELLEDVL